MIPDNEIIEGCNVLFKGAFFSVKWKLTNTVIIRPVSDIGFFETKYDGIDPIIITAAILEDVGFKKIHQNNFEYKSSGGNLYVVNLLVDEQVTLTVNDKILEQPITTLHQLQSAIFSATGDYLIIKNSGSAK
jgi:hypothetical protein